MAEGGVAAAMGNVDDRDSWRVHFADTMRGGQYLSNWRMAELHAKEAPERVRELEPGARFLIAPATAGFCSGISAAIVLLPPIWCAPKVSPCWRVYKEAEQSICWSPVRIVPPNTTCRSGCWAVLAASCAVRGARRNSGRRLHRNQRPSRK